MVGSSKAGTWVSLQDLDTYCKGAMQIVSPWRETGGTWVAPPAL